MPLPITRQSVLSKLSRIPCPLDVSLEDAFVCGPTRFLVIDWIFRLIEPALANITNHESESQLINRLSSLSVKWGLLHPGAETVVQGQCEESASLTFFDTLADLAHEASQEDASSRCIAFLSEIAANQTQVFHHGCELFPLDFMSKATQRPNLQQLQATLEESRAAVGRLSTELAFAKQNFPYDGTERPERASIALQTAIVDLRSTIAHFETIYDREIRQWLHQPSPTLIGMGPMAARLLAMQSRIMDVINSALIIQEQARRVVGAGQLNLGETFGIVSDTTVHKLRESVSILTRAQQYTS